MTAETTTSTGRGGVGVQLLTLGLTSEQASGLARSLDLPADQLLSLAADEWQETSWQAQRLPMAGWAVIAAVGPLVDSAELHRAVACIRLVFRPERLMIALPALEPGSMLDGLRGGATHFALTSTDSADLAAQLREPGVSREEYFPNPALWLDSLRNAAEQLQIDRPPEKRLKALLRTFSTNLGVDRASLALVDGDEVELVAVVGDARGLEEGQRHPLLPQSVTAWVLEKRMARLIQGELGKGSPRSAAQSAICAPIVSGDRALGVVSFSSIAGGRPLTHNDLIATELFATLLSLAITNQDLLDRSLENERLTALGSTTASVSHSLKNLLTIFRGSVDLMDRAIQRHDDSMMTVGFRMIRQGTRRIENLVWDLLHYAKDREPVREAVDLDDLIGHLRSDFETWQLHTGRSLETVLGARGSYMLDGANLERALLNLVNNAVEVTSDSGQVRLETEERDGWLHVRVSDDGPGVPPSELSRIFDPFYSTKGSKGTGLGLAMVAKFARENGGSASARTCPHLGGLGVEIRLPAQRPQET